MEAGVSDTPGGGGLSAAEADAVLASVRELFEAADPVPATLAERICFALAIEEHEAELLMGMDLVPSMAGARGEDRVRTVTFSSPRLSVMITVGDEGGDGVRVDGWIDAPEGAGGLRVELRRASAAPGSAPGSRSTVADEDGRFAFDAVAAGFVQFAFHAPEGEPERLPRSVVTPAIQV
jgi:protocatechuate 3,4-dioxygenase beta subunit